MKDVSVIVCVCLSVCMHESVCAYVSVGAVSPGSSIAASVISTLNVEVITEKQLLDNTLIYTLVYIV